DDSSPDKTGELVKETFAQDPHIKVIIRRSERGLATAILKGIQESEGTHIFLMDTDFNHDPKYLPNFFALAPFYDIVTGSRYTWGGDMLGGKARYLGSMFFNYVLALLLMMKSTDNTAGFVLFKKPLLEKMHPDKIFKGYGEFYFRFLYAAKLLKASLIEVPVVYSLRASGESKTFFWKYIFIYIFEALRLFFTGRKLIKK
ncbi:glycosyltransferase, partial [Patescibacteria group bacterium]|nr:glycosyltransferase [Patescibacteria group bacterium]